MIAEVKRASPSAGTIASGADAVAQAAKYADAGAAAISVLTDTEFFGGSLDDLEAVRAAVGVPVLRKDFILDPYQVADARAAGADMVLVIVAAVDAAVAVELAEAIREMSMTPLVEVHDHSELTTALAALDGGGILGVNSRNLRTLEVDLAAWADIARRVPPGVARIAESGIKTVADARIAREAGYDGVLCGEALMRAGDPGAFVAAISNGPST